jgi:hypothetical protein
VDVAPGVEMALVDLQAALDLAVVDPDDLDPEVAGKRPGDPLAEDVGGDGRVAQRSSAVPS